MPKSRKRRPKQQRSRIPRLPRATATPQLALGQPASLGQALGVKVAAESLLVSAHTNMWQGYMTSMPANMCILGCLTLRDALARVAIPAELITLRATVDFRDGRPPVTVGSLNPTMQGRSWSGHLGLWLPTLGRFCDPTIYQVNAHRRGEPFPSGIIIQLHNLAALDDTAVMKNGAVVTYELVRGPGALTWKPAIANSRAMQGLIRKGASAIHAAVRAELRSESQLRSEVARLTDPAVKDAVARIMS